MSISRRVYGPSFKSKLDLMGVRFNSPDPAAPGAGDPTPPAPVPPVPTPPAAPAAPVVPAAPAPAGRMYDQEYVSSLREEAKTHREKHEAEKKAREQDTVELETLRAFQAETVRTNAITTAAAEVDANVARLLDSKGFEKHFEGVKIDDPAAVTASLTAWLEKNPGDKNGPAVPGSAGSGQHTGTAPTQKPGGLIGAITNAIAPK